MTRVYLLRHASARLSEDQSDTDLFSTSDTGLSERGVAEARAAAAALAEVPIEAVFASDAQRAQHTARIVAEQHGLDVAVEPALIEVSFGPYGAPYRRIIEAILAIPDLFEAAADPLFPNGETHSQALARLTGAITRVARGNRHVVAVSHGIANRIVLGHALGLPGRELLRIDQDHACINVLDVEDGRIRVLGVNGRTAAPDPALRTDGYT